MTDDALLAKLKSGRVKSAGRFGPLRRGGGRGAFPRHPVSPPGRGRGPVGPRPPPDEPRPRVGPGRRALGTDQHARICAEPLNLTDRRSEGAAMSRITDRLRGVPPPRLPAGRRGRAAWAVPARGAPGRGPDAPDRRAKKPATGVIQIWLSGGPATIDMWDLKPDAPEEIRGEFRPIATAAPGVSICEHMPGLAKVMDRCTLVRSLGHTISAHGPGTIYMATGNRPGPALEYPAAGALAARLLPPRKGVPPYVTFAALRRRCLGHRARLPRPGVRPVRGRRRPARGDAPVARGVAPGGILAARPASPARP